MSVEKPKMGKKGAIYEIAKQLTSLRKKPISPKVHDIVRENYERTEKENKRVAKPLTDVEVQMAIWGYSELDALIELHPNITNGILIDTNILVAATYEMDRYHDVAKGFIDRLIVKNIPLYCNVNIRAEFLDMHRRIIASEAILGFAKICNKSELPPDLANELTNYRRRCDNHEEKKPDAPPLRLSDSEIKDFRKKMVKVRGCGTDLWTELSSDQIVSKIETVWNNTEVGLGLNFLSLRKEDQENYLNKKPEWDDVLKLMSNPGLSSYDAMIINMFFSSKFEAIASSDSDIAIALQKRGLNDKHAIVPDALKDEFSIL